MTERSEQEQTRRTKLQQLRESGFAFPNDQQITSTSSKLRELGEKIKGGEELEKASFTMAGRLMAFRHMGKASFCQVQDRDGGFQLYVRGDAVGVEAYAKFQELDLGDIVSATGYVFVTKTGEPSLHVDNVRLLVKCLHPLPEKWHGLTDVEVRYRQRYLDLIVNPEVRKVFQLRSRIISTMRDFFLKREYIEVETPIMSTIASGAAARPFETHHNALGVDLNLRIALELPLKRLVVGGLERVFEIGRVFRNEGISTQHNPEFTMIEFYEAYATYESLMSLTEELLVRLCDEVLGRRQIEFRGKSIDFSPPFRRLTMLDAVYELGGVSREHDLLTDAGVNAAARQYLPKGDATEALVTAGDYGRTLFELYDQLAEKHIVQPTFVTRHPRSISPLARESNDDPRFVDRFELFIAGMELANAFSELNDAEEQERRFADQLAAKERGAEEVMDLDEDFVRSLEYGFPPTAGEGIGIDRLVMMFAEVESIRDVILFPTMRPVAEPSC